LLQVVDDPSFSCLLMELAPKGSLRGLLETEPDAIVGNAGVQLSLAHDIASGMEYLHAMHHGPMLHHDLKSRNVLLFLTPRIAGARGAAYSAPSFGSPKASKLTAKIGDFGLVTGVSRTTYGESTSNRVGGGTLAYRAPETFRNEFSTASEVYAFGVIVWEMLTGARPWRVDSKGRAYNDAAIVLSVISGERPQLPERLRLTEGGQQAHAALKRLMHASWSHEATQRPPFSTIGRKLRDAMRREHELRESRESRESPQPEKIQTGDSSSATSSKLRV
jgi:serine/threonine protein kinase